VQPDNVTVVGLDEPSFTATRQSPGGAKERFSILKDPDASLVPMTTPFTVMGRFGSAAPSRRSLVPLSSARETWTVANAEEAAENNPTSASKVTSANRT